jgi:hypothetical protein
MDLGRASAARAADRLAVRPPFPPLAERWALMVELSIATAPVIPLDPVSLEHLKPDPLPAPSIEPVVDRRVGAVGSWTVALTPARTKHVHDPANHPTVVNPMRSTPAPRHQGFKLAPFRIGQHFTVKVGALPFAVRALLGGWLFRFRWDFLARFPTPRFVRLLIASYAA